MVKVNKTESEHPKSPCNRHCCLDENDICLGCFRTLNDILKWQSSTIAERIEILSLCQKRREYRCFSS
ncbi:DUF1289 domain-containing protein [Vibrio metschnikovii]|nr:DUF1289 domain-containing protein [Vibrio metschnikovii]EKO3937320.1 DUF1289 domain-containing protein [Vibrio metschnikovii]